jgi:hypothetical protein
LKAGVQYRHKYHHVQATVNLGGGRSVESIERKIVRSGNKTCDRWLNNYYTGSSLPARLRVPLAGHGEREA